MRVINGPGLANGWLRIDIFSDSHNEGVRE